MNHLPESAPPRQSRHNGLLHGLFALRYSYRGFVGTWQSESAFRQEVIAAVVLVPCAVFVPLPALERLLLVATTLLVLLVELLNSAIEAAIDRISLERHDLSGRAKDCGSAAVTIAILICAISWGVLCGPLALSWLRTLR